MSYARVGKYSVADPALTSGQSDFLRTNTRGEAIAVISGTTGNLVQATTNNALVATLIGSTGNLVQATTNNALVATLIGSAGNLVQATTDGALKVSGVSVTIASVIIDPSTAVVVGTIGLTTNAAQLTARACRKIYIQSDPDNTVEILIGTSASQPFQFSPGDAADFVIANLNLLYGKTASSTATLNWLAETS